MNEFDILLADFTNEELLGLMTTMDPLDDEKKLPEKHLKKKRKKKETKNTKNALSLEEKK